MSEHKHEYTKRLQLVPGEFTRVCECGDSTDMAFMRALMPSRSFMREAMRKVKEL